MVAPCEPLQIPQAFGAAQDAQHGHKQQIPGGDTNPAPHPRVGDRLEEADQIEISCGRNAFGHKEGTNPPTSAHADSPGNGACNGL
jgi:hypothetical protein